jgi:hypothetical protein
MINHQKDNHIKEKDQRIKELENEAETLHDRERFFCDYSPKIFF